MPIRAPRSPIELPDDDQDLWRYRNFTQFVSILEQGELWFSRADKLGDPFEGARPEHQSWASISKDFGAQQGIAESIEAMQFPDGYADTLSWLNERSRLGMYLNCWHANDEENDAMWAKYGTRGVAIQTKFGHLRDAIIGADVEPYAGRVNYIDFDSDSIPGAADLVRDYYLRFFYKRRPFAHENEVRLVVERLGAVFEQLKGVERPEEPWLESAYVEEQMPPGLPVRVDIGQLIDAVYVSPEAPDWYYRLATEVIDTYGYEWPVEQSTLSQSPSYG